MISPHKPELQVPSDDEDEEFHPTNPPREIEVEELPVEEVVLQRHTLMPGG